MAIVTLRELKNIENSAGFNDQNTTHKNLTENSRIEQQ